MLIRFCIIFIVFLLTMKFAFAKIVDVNNEQIIELSKTNIPIIDIRRSSEWDQTGVVPESILLTFFAVMVVFFMLYVIPISLKDSLSEALYKPMPVAELTDLNNSIISTGDFKGKTVVLDFFGTWCKPCIQELKELNHVQQYFKDDPSVAFFVINADMGVGVLIKKENNIVYHDDFEKLKDLKFKDFLNLNESINYVDPEEGIKIITKY